VEKVEELLDEYHPRDEMAFDERPKERILLVRALIASSLEARAR
jgi:hypothetical protein